MVVREVREVKGCEEERKSDNQRIKFTPKNL